MFRIPKITSFLTRTVSQTHTAYAHKEKLEWQRLTVLPRFYSKSKGRDKSGSCPPCDEEPCKKPPSQLPDCKAETDHPCAPQPCRRALQQYQDCPRPNRMDTIPEPDCAYEDNEGPRKKRKLIIFVVGTIIFLATCAIAYKVQTAKPPRPKGKKKSRRPQVIRKIPAVAKCIPKDVPYLLVGGGTASFSAFRAIKSADPTAKILVISNEGDFPYMRPPLSKEIWFNEDKEAVKKLTFKQWNGSERSLFYEPDDFYTTCDELMKKENGGVAVAKGWTITHIDVVERKAYLDNGDAITYGKCLIATGASPKNLDIFANSEQKIKDKVTLYRNIFDFEELNDIIEEDAKAIAIVGGGFLGSELACALARKAKGSLRVYQIFREGGNMGKILPEYLSFWATRKVKNEGVEVIPFTEVTGVKLRPQDDTLVLTMSNGKTVSANQVIVAVGVEPNTELAQKSDLEVDPELGGFLVNTELQARSHLYIAGDCACFYDTKLGRRRVEHHDHAVVSGRLAGENMTGGAKPYWHQSMFWSDLGPDVGYEAIGIVDSSLPTVGVFTKATPGDTPEAVVTATDEGIRSKTEEEGVPPECNKYFKKDPEQEKLAAIVRREASKPQTAAGEDFGKGVIFYLRDNIVVGIVLWNLFNRMNIARQVLKDESKYDDLNEVAKLFNIHED